MTAWDPRALEDLASYCHGQRSTGLLVVHERRTVLERSWPVPAGYGAFERCFVHGATAQGALREDVASQQKSVTAPLAAIAADRGLPEVEQPVSHLLGGGWSRAEAAHEGAILVRHLLEMCSGLDDALRSAHPAGTHHAYNTPACAVILPVLEAAAEHPLDTLTREWLTGPAGMDETFWRRRVGELARQFGNPRGLVSTPRDLALLGQLVLDGRLAHDGTRLVGAAGLASLFRRTALHPAYGRLALRLARSVNGPGGSQ